MIFEGMYEVANGNELAATVLEHFPDPRDLLGKELKVSWQEEAYFDSVAGMFWPIVLCQIVTEKYNERGTSWGGFGSEITFSEDDSGVLLIFTR